MNSLLEKCNKLGLKMTEQRRVITQVLSESKDHPDVELVYKRASKIDKNIGIATVYRTIKLFEENNIIEKHEFKDGRSRYTQSVSSSTKTSPEKASFFSLDVAKRE